MLVPGAVPDHEFFDVVRPELAKARTRGRLVAHSIAECFSVLTRAGLRTPQAAVAYLGQFLREPAVGVAPDRYPAVIEELVSAGVSGGAIYDGLIAVASREAGGMLVSLDARAARNYERCGVQFRLLSEGSR